MDTLGLAFPAETSCQYFTPSEAIKAGIKTNASSSLNSDMLPLYGAIVKAVSWSSDRLCLTFENGMSLTLGILSNVVRWQVDNVVFQTSRPAGATKPIAVTLHGTSSSEDFIWDREGLSHVMLGHSLIYSFFGGSSIYLYFGDDILQFSVLVERDSGHPVLYWSRSM